MNLIYERISNLTLKIKIRKEKKGFQIEISDEPFCTLKLKMAIKLSSV